MRYLVLLAALLMPIMSWLTMRGTFGPDTASISDRYPTLVVAAGYAFSIWGLIFLLDVVYGVWQTLRVRDPAVQTVAPAAFAGFALTAIWMPVFSQEWFELALVIIWAALGFLLWSAWALSRRPLTSELIWAWLPLSLHSGWLSLAAFLNTAQVIVAREWLSTAVQLPWSVALMGLAAVLLLIANARMRGNIAYVAAAVWALVAVYVRQSQATLDGAAVTALAGLVIAAVLLSQTAWLRLRNRDVLHASKPSG